MVSQTSLSFNNASVVTRQRTRILAVLLFTLALFPRLLITLQPIPVQLDKTLPDDAYYYYLTAENILAGKGYSVDGMNNSNGWHPLWMLINLGIFALPVSGLDLPVQLILFVGAVLDSLVVLVLYLTMRRYVSNISAILGAGLYAINNMPIFQAVNGLETALSALFIALSWAHSMHLIEQPSRPRAIIWGLTYGLCFLSRTDTALVLGCLGLFTIFRLPNKSRWMITVLGATVAVVVVIPWLIWNQVNFGSAFVQVSSVAVPWAARTRFELANPGIPIWRFSLDVISDPAFWLRGDYLGAPIIIGLFLWLLAIWGLLRAWPNLKQRQLVLICLPLIMGGCVLIAVHTLLRWYPRPWYFVVMAQALSIGIALFWEYLPASHGKAILLCFSLVGAVIFGILGWSAGYYPWQTNLMYKGALWIRDNTPKNSLIASMNSGIIGYYSGRVTINLDGVVNPNAFAASQSKQLMQYIKERNVRYFLDFDNALLKEYGPFMGPNYLEALTEVQNIGEYPELGQYRIYEVNQIENTSS